MTPQIATLTVALIALMIGAALKFRIGWAYTQIDLLTPKHRFIVFTKTWKAALTAAGSMAGLVYALTSIGHIEHLGALIATGMSSLMFGAVTFNWLWPATGAVTPTALQVINQDSATVDVTTDGVAVTFTVTHNLGISAADITAGFPIIIIEPNSATGIPATLLLVITRPIATGNAVIFTCAAIAATFRVRVLRPHTIGR